MNEDHGSKTVDYLGSLCEIQIRNFLANTCRNASTRLINNRLIKRVAIGGKTKMISICLADEIIINHIGVRIVRNGIDDEFALAFNNFPRMKGLIEETKNNRLIKGKNQNGS